MSDHRQSVSLDQALNIDDHYSDLLEDFFDVRNKWETFGLRLGLTDATLESFQGDDEEKFRMVLKALLRGNRRDPCTPITLSRMLSALKSPTVGLTQLAEDLERKYTSESGTTDELPQRNTTQPDDAQNRYTRLLALKLRQVRLSYKVLIKNGKESFKMRDVPVSEVIEVVIHNHDKYYDHRNINKAALEKMKSMDEIWDAFSQHTSWYNSEMVEAVVKLHGKETDKKHLDDYLTERKSLLHHLNIPQHSREAALTLKLQDNFEHFTNEKIELVRLAICDLLECQVCALDKKHGCVEITLFIPANVAENAFPLSSSMKKAFQKMFPTLISVTCRDIIEKFELNVNVNDTASASKSEEEKYSEQGFSDDKYSIYGSESEEEEEKVEEIEEREEKEREEGERERKERKKRKRGLGEAEENRARKEQKKKRKQDDFQIKSLNAQATGAAKATSFVTRSSALKHKQRAEITGAATCFGRKVKEYEDSLELHKSLKEKAYSSFKQFTPSNVQPLERVLQKICRGDIIAKEVQQFQQELLPSPLKAKDDATPVNDIDEEASLPSIK